MQIDLPDFALVVLVGASGSGKSTFAGKHFLPTEVLSSDYLRGVVCDDEGSLEATGDAFAALHYLAGIRLKRRKLTVIDATNVQEHARKPLLALAHQYHAVPVAIVLDVPEKTCYARNQARPNRDFGPHVVQRHSRELKRSLKFLKKEGFRYVFHLDGEEAIAATELARVPLWTDRRTEHGPFDFIGDVHGCYDELQALLGKLGYDEAGGHPENRRLVFVGDLVDRGPKSVEVASFVMEAVAAGRALCVPGNHDDKLKRALEGKKVTVNHGLEQSLEQIDALPEAEREAFKARFIAFVESLVSHLWLEDGALCVAHAGIREDLIGRASRAVREFCLYGDPTGERDERGLPIRRDWAADYSGKTNVIYGHTPIERAQWRGNTINLDTGCVFGGQLTALRWPERTIVGVEAKASYAEHPQPLREAEAAKSPFPSDGGAPAPREYPGVGERLNLADFVGRRIIETRLGGNITVNDGNAAAALEVISRFAAHPRWLAYLPPTMSPVETSKTEGYLERPEEACAYFVKNGFTELIAQEKHMGSRAVVVVCRDQAAAQRRFGAESGETGVILTRTGRPFFDTQEQTEALLSELRAALTETGLWDELKTDWVILDSELLPWNAKAQGLLRGQYAPVGAAGRVALSTARELAEKANLPELAQRLQERESCVGAYQEAYGRYCWSVSGLSGVKLAPFQILAVEGRTLLEQDHLWHMQTLARLAAVSERFVATQYQLVQADNAEQVKELSAWWDKKTEEGMEGIVVKTRESIPVRNSVASLRVQPAVKVRGREYLRIIYGPEYTDPAHLSRLRERGLSGKRSLALREFSLGIEGLERFVRREPLRRVHECAFATLALESEPVDPRL
ncbi:polynucleotide kinase-phosphatase [Armatimonas rosea]|uniref:Protein phosphatase n=1 Tax=Armatimonas rosea TaxID=685828 RepID=A0A7W9SNJ3_ARMRO|nr:polynucleotide kinase-phosphatase [Armatimonas rosea]MBB6049268.1 protein phosphatase [Armatimonas rosea]